MLPANWEERMVAILTLALLLCLCVGVRFYMIGYSFGVRRARKDRQRGFPSRPIAA